MSENIRVYGKNNIVSSGVKNVLIVGDGITATESDKEYISEDLTKEELISIIKFMDSLMVNYKKIIDSNVEYDISQWELGKK